LNGRTIFVGDAHGGDGQGFIMRADEKLTAFEIRFLWQRLDFACNQAQ
jgi:hypothetical protein